MKLRTRLALIAGAVTLLATLLCGGMALQISSRNMLDLARTEGERENQEIVWGFTNYLDSFSRDLSPQLAAYYFKSRDDDYTILLQDGLVCYNPTTLNPAVLSNSAADFQEIFYQGRRLMVFVTGAGYIYTLYHITDITDTYLNIYSLAARIGLIVLGTVALAFLALFWMLRRSLRPLQALSEGARSIAAGAYDRRAPEGRRDEIGQLGRDFNKMAEAVERHIREVQDSEDKKTLFMGSLTHELKTPLTAISGYAQTLRYAKLSDEDRELALDYIYQESQRLDRLSKKMLRLLELDRETGLAMEPLEVRALFEAARRTCLPAAKEKAVAIHIGPCEGQVQGDRDLLTEALINLVDNAVKACWEGGQVELYTEDGALVVEDNGRGIPQEDLGRLTEPFYMVDKSRSRKSGGAGLGLALAAAILRRHGMKLHMESQVGAGTKAAVFSF